jgi:hypothetical protein
VTEEEMRKRLEALRLEHRDLDVAIDALSGSGIASGCPAQEAQAQTEGPDLDARGLSDPRHHRVNLPGRVDGVLAS